MELSLPMSNRFVNNYMNNQLQMDRFFDYSIHTDHVYNERLEDVLKQTYKREELVEYLKAYHTKFNNCEATIRNIERLQQPNAVVVVGGQQAGLLTGPLYTIHKIISIITLAKEQEELLGVPVIPVFWIAGEDHDFEEINHVCILNQKRIKKKSILQVQAQKKMISNLMLDKEACVKWVEEVFASYGETSYTNELLKQLYAKIESSNTYVDFFEAIVMELFREEGLVLLNSASKELRHLEKDYFLHLFKRHKEIYWSVRQQQKNLQDNTYKPMIHMRENSTNLFYHVNDERWLLVEDVENNVYSIPELGIELQKDEVIKRIKEYPEHFSNNVVTRPLMQEMLLPTLAFIAGPGEIAYWAELKNAFHACNLKMPIVVPRLNITLLERHIDSDFLEFHLPLDRFFKEGVDAVKDEWLKQHQPIEFEPLVQEAKRQIEDVHSSLREKAIEIDKSLQPILRKNAHFIQSQLDFLTNVVQKRVHQMYEKELYKLQRMELSLLPNGLPQERVWNIFYYLNKYGPDFVKLLQQQTFHFNGKHKVVKI